MQRPLRLVHVLLLLVTQAATAMAPADAPNPDTSGGITEIVLERTACTRTCPVDTLVLRASGKAEYTGRQNTSLTGEFAGPLAKDEFDRLARWLVTEGFFDMKNSYGSSNAATAGTVIRVTRGGERKSVTSHAPDQSLDLWSMGNAIRAVVAEMRWQPARSGIRGQISLKQPGQDWQPRPNDWLRIAPAGTTQSLVYIADHEGRFEINLAPGTYSVTSQHDRGTPRTVVVEPDRFTQTDFRFDTTPANAPATNAAPAASSPPPPPDGLYRTARGTAAKWTLWQDQRAISLADRTEPAILKKQLDSDSADNSTFMLELTIPFDATVTPYSHVLVIGGKAYEGVCQRGGDTSLLCFRMEGEERAQQVAKYFGVMVGRFTKPDYKLRVSITPTKPSFKRGEPITATLKIVNGGTEYPLLTGEQRGGRRDDYQFTARRNGQALTDISFAGDRGGTSVLRGMEPGKTFEDTVNLGKWFEFKEAGVYQIHGSYRLNFEATREAALPWVKWTEYAETDFIVTIE